LLVRARAAPPGSPPGPGARAVLTGPGAKGVLTGPGARVVLTGTPVDKVAELEYGVAKLKPDDVTGTPLAATAVAELLLRAVVEDTAVE
jgi:hypothetical protein